MNAINDFIERVMDAGFVQGMLLIFKGALLVMVLIGAIIAVAMALLGQSSSVTYPAENSKNTTILVGKVIMPAIECHQWRAVRYA